MDIPELRMSSKTSFCVPNAIFVNLSISEMKTPSHYSCRNYHKILNMKLTDDMELTADGSILPSW